MFEPSTTWQKMEGFQAESSADAGDLTNPLLTNGFRVVWGEKRRLRFDILTIKLSLVPSCEDRATF
jgi:hypothetical protein